MALSICFWLHSHIILKLLQHRHRLQMIYRSFVLPQILHFIHPKYRWWRNGRFHHAHPSSSILLYPILDTTLLLHKDECGSFLREFHISTVCSKRGIWFTHSTYDCCLTLWHLSSQSSYLHPILQHLNLRSTIRSWGRQRYSSISFIFKTDTIHGLF